MGHDIGRLGCLHAQTAACDLIDAIAFGPRRLLQLQTAEFDIEFIATALQSR
jgi:hypothetical protein